LPVVKRAAVAGVPFAPRSRPTAARSG
jgi:hypothetical protein